jgi:hypothetical protein
MPTFTWLDCSKRTIHFGQPAESASGLRAGLSHPGRIHRSISADGRYVAMPRLMAVQEPRRKPQPALDPMRGRQWNMMNVVLW